MEVKLIVPGSDVLTVKSSDGQTPEETLAALLRGNHGRFVEAYVKNTVVHVPVHAITGYYIA